MDYRKQLKWMVIGAVALIFIFATIYCASVTRAENVEDENSSNYNLKTLVNFVKRLWPNFNSVAVVNTASLDQTDRALTVGEEVFVLTQGALEEADDSLNRELLNICLAKAEDEWNQLQKHYADVLVQCLDIDLGLSGGKLFSNEECEAQVKPYREKDKQRIQFDKIDCFDRYSERE